MVSDPSEGGRSPLMARLWARGRGLPLPRRTVRLRLTLVYGALFLASGVALLAITYFLVKQDIGDNFAAATKNGTAAMFANARHGNVTIGFAQISSHSAEATAIGPRFGDAQYRSEFTGKGAPGAKGGPAKLGPGNVVIQVPFPGTFPGGRAPSPRLAKAQLDILWSEAQTEQNAELHQLLLDSGVALLIMAVLSILLGWLVAGRALRPLRVITSKAHDISSTNLHERIALRGPDDEMKRLGDTFDALLARLERAFDAQRQFVANASHELRTPLARQRTVLEVASGDPEADVLSLREASLKAIAAGEEQERLIEALLTLASSERGLDDRCPIDLADVARRVVESKRAEASLRDLEIRASLAHAPTTGNGRLVERLVANLVENALRYNDPRGWVNVATAVGEGDAVLHLANSGPIVPQTELDRLFEPFQRLASDRISREGHGLGLSIVRAVAIAHGATVRAESRPTGGLDVRVAFPLDMVEHEKAPPAGNEKAPPAGNVKGQVAGNVKRPATDPADALTGPSG
jgi:signal transduction histidine kinase